MSLNVEVEHLTEVSELSQKILCLICNERSPNLRNRVIMTILSCIGDSAIANILDFHLGIQRAGQKIIIALLIVYIFSPIRKHQGPRKMEKTNLR